MKKLIAFFIVIFVIFSVPSATFASTSNMDVINHYGIKVDVRNDGTMDIHYLIKWTVLDDKNGKEPVTWIKVGIPNKHVDQVVGISDNIKKCEYYSKGGDFVRIDLDREYKKNETFIVEFTIHQSYMYFLDEEGIVRYSFTPGWFEEIEIQKLVVSWAFSDDLITSDATRKEGDFLVWEYENIPSGVRKEVNVRYDSANFYTNPDEQAETPNFFWIIIIIIAIFVFIMICCDDGYGGSGISGGHYYHSSGGGSRSCACACACAGGGRAGCSVKDFYKNRKMVKVEDIDSAFLNMQKGKR